MTVVIQKFTPQEFLELAKNEPNIDVWNRIQYLNRETVVSDTYKILAAINDNGEVVGICRLELRTPEQGQVALYPRTTSIHPEYQRQGLAKSMLTEAFTMASKSQIDDEAVRLHIGMLTDDGEHLFQTIIDLQKVFPSVTLQFDEPPQEVWNLRNGKYGEYIIPGVDQ